MVQSLINKRILIFQLCVLLGLFQNLNGQTLDLSPTSATAGEYITVIISGTGIDFQQNSTTICPSSLSVNTSNVVFTQGTSTIHPYDLNTFSGILYAYVFVPADAAPGNYDLAIGMDGACPIINNGAFLINTPAPSVYANPSYVNSGQTVSIIISGSGVFQQSSPTVCPGNLNVNVSNVFFIQGSSTLYPETVNTYDGVIYASVSIPPGIPTGYYELIVGNGEPCAIINPYGLYVDVPYIGTNVNPSYISAGQSLDVTISGIGLSFDQSSPTSCPGNLNVTASNVVFIQGSSTIRPNSISISNNEITAHLDVPLNAPPGYYDMIVGYGELCPVVNYSALYIDGNVISVNPNNGLKGHHIKVDISGPNVIFEQGPSTCAGILNVTASDVVFVQGSTTIYPDKISMHGGILTAELFLTNDIPTGIYNVIVGHDCTYYGYFNVVNHVDKPNTVIAYPNPSDGTVLNVDITDPGTHTIYLYNSSGIEIYRETINSPELVNIAAKINQALTPGIYLINIITNDGIAKKRIVIN